MSAFRFSSRLPAELTPSRLARARRDHPGFVDLMQSNPTAVRLRYPRVQAPLCGAGAPPYAPASAGGGAARAALAAFCRRCGEPVDAARLLMTASTSEAYAHVLKLLCDPGDAVAVGAPGYPLVQHLAELEAVRCVPYLLHHDGGAWRLDLDSVAAALRQPRLRALVLVVPGNPTGHVLEADEAAALARLCRAAGVTLVVDQVFAPYATRPGPPAAQLLRGAPRLLVLDGLSKAAALPQLKLGWLAAHGDPAWVAAALARLGWIADAYLSVNAPVQQALPTLLASAPALQAQLRRRLTANRRALAAALRAVPAATVLAGAGGWYAVLRLPQHLDEEAVALDLLRAARLGVHPGFFYDFPQRGLLVVGLLLPPRPFAAAAARLAARLAALCDGTAAWDDDPAAWELGAGAAAAGRRAG